ncbi:MAG: isochorismatase family protein [Alphaproteobacteria bacterium]|nr:isochorismatase family protein [Alphaproteobacteria bacterium]
MTDSSDLATNYRGVFDGRMGFGRSPAILVVDFIRAYTERGSPLFAPAVVEAVKATAPLLQAARRRRVPIIYTRVLYHRDGIDGGLFVYKVPALRAMVEGNPLADIVPELPPGAADLVLIKQYASAFFGTSLAATLTAWGIDTLVIAGCSTSGCVRATAVDAMQHGFRPIVPRECVGDRHDGPHEANLFDINAKYGDVLPLAEVMRALEGTGAKAAKAAST